MGERGPLPKPAVRAQGHRTHDEPKDLAVVPARIGVPAPSEEWLPDVLEAWDGYWTSDVAKTATQVDLPAIRRLFDLYDQRDRAMQVVRTALVVKGSAGQIRVNPVADHALKLETAILRLENELGLTPLSRARLGLAVHEVIETLEDLKRKAVDGDERKRDDPRRISAVE